MGLFDKIKDAAKGLADKAGNSLDQMTIDSNTKKLKYGIYVCDFENCRGDFTTDIDVYNHEKGVALVSGADRKKYEKMNDEGNENLDITVYQLPQDMVAGTFRLKTIKKTKMVDEKVRVRKFTRHGSYMGSESTGRKVEEFDRLCFDVTMQFSDKKLLIGELERSETAKFLDVFYNANYENIQEIRDDSIGKLEKENDEIRDKIASGDGDQEELTELLQSNQKLIKDKEIAFENAEKFHNEEIERINVIKDKIAKAKDKMESRKSNS